jgi:hypothetical protein
MATGWTQAELDALCALMEALTPEVPCDADKHRAARVTAMRVAGTEKGLLFNFEMKGGHTDLFWLNCWVAKELAGAINVANQAYGWLKRGLSPAPSQHLRPPTTDDLPDGADVISLATLAEPGGMLVRLVIERQPQHRLMFFPVKACLEILSAVGQGGNAAGWWGSDFELIPRRESQN